MLGHFWRGICSGLFKIYPRFLECFASERFVSENTSTSGGSRFEKETKKLNQVDIALKQT